MTLYIDTKPTLEWEETIDHWWYAVSDYGMYRIKINHWLSVDINLHLYQCQDVVAFHSVHESIEAAKAAAQADYERRTAERFRPITLPPRMNAREGDGSVHYCTGWNDVLDAIAKATEAAP